MRGGGFPQNSPGVVDEYIRRAVLSFYPFDEVVQRFTITKITLISAELLPEVGYDPFDFRASSP